METRSPFYHYLADAVGSFLGTASRDALQVFIFLASIGGVGLGIALANLQGLAPSKAVLSYLIGGTDFLAALLFFQRLLFMVGEVQRYSRVIDAAS